MYAKDLYGEKYQNIIHIHEGVGLKHWNYSISYIEYFRDMMDVYNNIDQYNFGKEQKILTAIDDIIAEIQSNKKLGWVVTELFVRVRDINFLLFSLRNLILKYQKKSKWNVHPSSLFIISFKEFSLILHLTIFQGINGTNIGVSYEIWWKTWGKEEKVQCDSNIATTRISVLSSSKMDKHEYLSAREILPLQQLNVIEETKITFSTWNKSFLKTSKNNWRTINNSFTIHRFY